VPTKIKTTDQFYAVVSSGASLVVTDATNNKGMFHLDPERCMHIADYLFEEKVSPMPKGTAATSSRRRWRMRDRPGRNCRSVAPVQPWRSNTTPTSATAESPNISVNEVADTLGILDAKGEQTWPFEPRTGASGSTIYFMPPEAAKVVKEALGSS
jgi:hypothetical protein